MSKRRPSLTKAVAFPEARGGLSFDRSLHAAMARLAAGISLTAQTQAYADWARRFPRGCAPLEHVPAAYVLEP